MLGFESLDLLLEVLNDGVFLVEFELGLLEFPVVLKGCLGELGF